MNEPLQVGGDAAEAFAHLQNARSRLARAQVRKREEARKRNLLKLIDIAINSRYWDEGDE